MRYYIKTLMNRVVNVFFLDKNFHRWKETRRQLLHLCQYVYTLLKKKMFTCT